MESPEEGYTRVVLVEDGDLIIQVLDTSASWENKEFLVDSNTVKRSSEPLEMLVSERMNPKYDLVHIEGSAEYLGLVFPIMHCKFGDVPSVFDESKLYEFLRVAENYEVIHLLRPWAATWIKPLRDESFLCRLPSDDAMRAFWERLWIAWVLGLKAIFRNLTKYIIKEVPLNDEYFLRAGDWGEVLLVDIPKIPGFLEYLKMEQVSKLEQLHGVFEEAMERYDECYSCHTSPGQHPAKQCRDYDCCECGKRHIEGQFCQLCTRPEDERAMCNSIILGSIIRGYRQYKVYSIEECGMLGLHGPGQLERSLDHHFGQLRAIEIYGLPEAAGHQTKTVHGRTHGDCNPTAGIRAQLEDVMSDIAENLGTELESGLDARARLFGMNNQLKRAGNGPSNEAK